MQIAEVYVYSSKKVSKCLFRRDVCAYVCVFKRRVLCLFRSVFGREVCVLSQNTLHICVQKVGMCSLFIRSVCAQISVCFIRSVCVYSKDQHVCVQKISMCVCSSGQLPFL